VQWDRTGVRSRCAAARRGCAAAPPLLPEDTVLITGGLDGGGLAIARRLAGAYDCNLVLTSRDAASADLRAREVGELERRGATVLALTADPGSEARMREVVEAAVDAFGAIRAVVHTVDERAVDDQGAVVRGFHAMRSALAGHTIRRVALCPADEFAAAVLGAYAVAHPSSGHEPWTVIDLADEPSRLEEGDLLDRILAADHLDHVVVASGPSGGHPAPSAVRRPAAKPGDGGQSARLPRPALATPFVEPAEGFERAVADALAAGLGLDGLGADDNFFELGGRSATAVQLAARLGDGFRLPLPATALVEHPTVRLLSARLAEMAGAEQPAP